MKKIQSVLFPRKQWSKLQAKDYLKYNGYKFNDIDTTINFYRFRQRRPSKKVKYYTGTMYSGNKKIEYIYYFAYK